MSGNSFFYFLFPSSSLSSHQSGPGRAVGGVSVKNKNDNIDNYSHCPVLSSTSPPSSCLIMLLCVCLSVCISCVMECVFLRSLCQCVCSSNTGFSPYYPPTSSPLLSSPLMVTHLPPLNFKSNLFLFWISFHYFWMFPTLSHSTFSVPHHFHSHTHSLIHSLTLCFVCSSQLPS